MTEKNNRNPTYNISFRGDYKAAWMTCLAWRDSSTFALRNRVIAAAWYGDTHSLHPRHTI
ncbi:MAG: hypothetical protein P8L85_08540 [Rubripirellula sp.]|nr:hypothetical protein [Rubripirellula sp.]